MRGKGDLDDWTPYGLKVILAIRGLANKRGGGRRTSGSFYIDFLVTRFVIAAVVRNRVCREYRRSPGAPHEIVPAAEFVSVASAAFRRHYFLYRLRDFSSHVRRVQG